MRGLIVNILLTKFEIQIDTKLFLPPWKGSTLRGALGRGLYEVTCFNKHLKDCVPCPLKKECIFHYIFVTTPPRNADVLRKQKHAVRPYVIEPSMQTRTEFSENESLEFNLLLFGKAIKYFPQMVAAFEVIGKKGIGKFREQYGKFHVEKVSAINELTNKTAIAFSNGVRNVPRDIIMTFKDFQDVVTNSVPNNTSKFSLDFISPLCLVHKNQMCTEPLFEVLIRRLLGRFSSIAYFHHKSRVDGDWVRKLIEDSSNVRITDSNLDEWQIERYSARTNRRIELRGIVGTASYEGILNQDLWTLLYLGKYLHIGQNSVQGFGKYEIAISYG